VVHEPARRGQTWPCAWDSEAEVWLYSRRNYRLATPASRILIRKDCPSLRRDPVAEYTGQKQSRRPSLELLLILRDQLCSDISIAMDIEIIREDSLPQSRLKASVTIKKTCGTCQGSKLSLSVI
jgi:hypothetical protein